MKHQANLALMPMGLTVIGSALVKDGTQVWMRGYEVLDITTDERARFIAQFGLMQIPSPRANKVMLSIADYDALVAATKGRS